LPAEGDINCIYGVRAVCTIALYLAHKVISLAFSPYSNRVVLTEVTVANIYRVILFVGVTHFQQSIYYFYTEDGQIL
jgi:hypothetical protein